MVVPVDDTGEVCVSTLVDTEVVVDLSGWFDTGLQLASGRIVDTRDDGATRTVVPGAPCRAWPSPTSSACPATVRSWACR